jgi:hypothetical protein
MKRTREEEDVGDRPTKILRGPAEDRLSKLSDELFVRILSFGSVSTLLVCQRYVLPSTQRSVILI